jgi:hypothetical protein
VTDSRLQGDPEGELRSGQLGGVRLVVGDGLELAEEGPVAQRLLAQVVASLGSRQEPQEEGKKRGPGAGTTGGCLGCWFAECRLASFCGVEQSGSSLGS